MKKTMLSALCLSAMLATSCQGYREANGHFTVHAESFRIFGFAIPSCDQDAATKLQMDKFPGATIHTQHSTAADWTSVTGVLGNIFGFHCTTISGKSN